MKKAIYAIRDRKLPEQIRKRIPEQWSGNSFIPPGWRGLVCLLDKELAEVYPEYELHQVKSKYGTLRYYINFTDTDERNDQVYDIINKYEDLSAHICEICGQEGKKRGDQRWIVTRCENHKE